jgi:cyclic pyranopterin phosphate synthase
LQGPFGSEVARRESRAAGRDNESGETLGHGEERCGDGADPVGDDAAIVDLEVCFVQTRLKDRSGAVLAPSLAHRVRDGQNFCPIDHEKRVGDIAGWAALGSLTRRSVKSVMDDARSIDGRDDSDGVASLTGRTLASSRVTMLESTARQVEANSLNKGDVLGAARYAGVQAAKATASYLPLFDPVLTRDVVVNFEVGVDYVDVRVEVPGDGLDAWMPALTAATVASLTIFDMCKAVDRTMTIGPVELVNAG